MTDEIEGEGLRRLLDAAAELPREVTPPPGAWAEIRGRIDAKRVQAIAPSATPARRTIRWWSLAAAAVVVFVVGSAVVARRGKARDLANTTAAHDSVAVPLSIESPPQSAAPVRAVTAVPAALAAANPALASALEQYQQASRELETAVLAQTTGLPPATREVVRRSLQTIDSAIGDLRAALGSDPRNASLGQYLSAAYEQKLDFLKRVRAMPGAGM